MNLVRRVGAGAVVVWAVFTVVFGILRVLPGDPVALAANADGGGAPPSPATIAALRAQYRLDDPLWRQYLSTLGDFITGNWGTSLVTGQPVTTTLWQALPSTAVLAGLALAIGIPAAFGIAFALGWRRVWWQFALVMVTGLAVVAVFWLNIIAYSAVAGASMLG